jgi:nucleotidyltransferase substrate binding protein (TIGR01987 family)
VALDLSSLEGAVNSLETAVSTSLDRELMGRLDEETRDVVRAGVIQNFEFTFELCWKFIQRWIRINKTPEDAEPRTRKDLFRMAARYGLIEDPRPWFGYADARNITSHTYNKKKAETVYRVAVRFVKDARFLLEQLRQTND